MSAILESHETAQPFGHTLEPARTKILDAKGRMELAQVMLFNVLSKIKDLGVTIKITNGRNVTNARPLTSDMIYFTHPNNR